MGKIKGYALFGVAILPLIAIFVFAPNIVKNLGEREAAGDYDYEAIYSDAPSSDGLDVDAYFKKHKDIAERFAALPEQYSARAYEAMNEEHLLKILSNVEGKQKSTQ